MIKLLKIFRLIKAELEKEFRQLKDLGAAFNVDEELQTKERGFKLYYV